MNTSYKIDRAIAAAVARSTSGNALVNLSELVWPVADYFGQVDEGAKLLCLDVRCDALA